MKASHRLQLVSSDKDKKCFDILQCVIHFYKTYSKLWGTIAMALYSYIRVSSNFNSFVCQYHIKIFHPPHWYYLKIVLLYILCGAPSLLHVEVCKYSFFHSAHRLLHSIRSTMLKCLHPLMAVFLCISCKVKYTSSSWMCHLKKV